MKRSPIRKRNAKRAREKYERNFGAWSDSIRKMRCWWCFVPGPSEACHMMPRSRGGDKTMLLPGCRECHDWIDTHPLIRATYIADARALFAEHNERAA
jgi:hypothetical protein